MSSRALTDCLRLLCFGSSKDLARISVYRNGSVAMSLAGFEEQHSIAEMGGHGLFDGMDRKSVPS